MKSAFAYVICVSIFSQAAGQLSPIEIIDYTVFVALLFMLFWPEVVSIFRPGIWLWIKNGIENSDGHLSSSDFYTWVTHYISFGFFRLSSVVMYRSTFFGSSVDWQTFTVCVFAAFGVELLRPLVNKIFGKL